MKMKYDYKNYDFPLNYGMKDVLDIYKKYIINKDDEKLYDQLKDAIYSLSLDIKSAKVCNQISPVESEEMKEYYWGLLL